MLCTFLNVPIYIDIKMLTRMHSQITCIYGSLQLSEKLSQDFKIDKKCFPRL